MRRQSLPHERPRARRQEIVWRKGEVRLTGSVLGDDFVEVRRLDRVDDKVALARDQVTVAQRDQLAFACEPSPVSFCGRRGGSTPEGAPLQYSWSCSNRSGRSQTLILVVQAGQRCPAVAQETRSLRLTWRNDRLCSAARRTSCPSRPCRSARWSHLLARAALRLLRRRRSSWLGGEDGMTALSVGGSVVGPRRR